MKRVMCFLILAIFFPLAASARGEEPENLDSVLDSLSSQNGSTLTETMKNFLFESRRPRFCSYGKELYLLQFKDPVWAAQVEKWDKDICYITDRFRLGSTAYNFGRWATKMVIIGGGVGIATADSFRESNRNGVVLWSGAAISAASAVLLYGNFEESQEIYIRTAVAIDTEWEIFRVYAPRLTPDELVH